MEVDLSLSGGHIVDIASRKQSEPVPAVRAHRPGRPRGARSGLTRERIVTAARGVFSECGYAATTFQAVAERAQLTRPAVNHYFANKQQLYAAVLAEYSQIIVAAIDAARTQTGLLQRLSSLTTQLHRGERAAAAFVVTAVLDAQRHPELRDLAQGLEAPAREFLTGALTEAIDQGELVTASDVSTLTEMVLAVLWGIGFYVAFVGGYEESEAVIAHVNAMLAQQLWQLR